ncbi:uncharacterized protein LOC108681310 [Hyalella azteca]|uniref:Uncharacterized protein LOC108681310 n=1 Tax=Hyalella azteca TaxID=294128 RepID=A0A8B7PKB7_HYAAZ|nr:uncharacterized protein LOC108681310 [Hyalella azteca]
MDSLKRTKQPKLQKASKIVKKMLIDSADPQRQLSSLKIRSKKRSESKSATRFSATPSSRDLEENVKNISTDAKHTNSDQKTKSIKIKFFSGKKSVGQRESCNEKFNCEANVGSQSFPSAENPKAAGSDVITWSDNDVIGPSLELLTVLDDFSHNKGHKFPQNWTTPVVPSHFAHHERPRIESHSSCDCKARPEKGICETCEERKHFFHDIAHSFQSLKDIFKKHDAEMNICPKQAHSLLGVGVTFASVFGKSENIIQYVDARAPISIFDDEESNCTITDVQNGIQLNNVGKIEFEKHPGDASFPPTSLLNKDLNFALLSDHSHQDNNEAALVTTTEGCFLDLSRIRKTSEGGVVGNCAWKANTSVLALSFNELLHEQQYDADTLMAAFFTTSTLNCCSQFGKVLLEAPSHCTNLSFCMDMNPDGNSVNQTAADCCGTARDMIVTTLVVRGSHLGVVSTISVLKRTVVVGRSSAAILDSEELEILMVMRTCSSECISVHGSRPCETTHLPSKRSDPSCQNRDSGL